MSEQILTKSLPQTYASVSRPARKCYSDSGTVINRYCIYRLPSKAFSLVSTNDDDNNEWSRRNKLILTCLLVSNCFAMMCLSVMAPFYPSEAAQKGLTLTQSSWIFAVFALTEFIFAPIWGQLIPYIHARFMFLAGMFFAGSCYILFGSAVFLPPGRVYLCLCMLLRVFTALGCSAASTATYTITAATFKSSLATVFGLIETSTGVGLSLGPTIGGVLYDLGGFMLPFALLGILMVCMVAFGYLTIPSSVQVFTDNSGGVSICRLVRMPAVLVTCGCVFLSAIALSAPEPTLEPHLLEIKQPHLSPTLIGLVFLLMTGSYGLLAPLIGYIADKLTNSTPLMALGFAISGLAFMLLGPSVLLGFKQSYNVLWLNLVALVLLGAGLSCGTVPTFQKIINTAKKEVSTDSIHGIVAGLWGSSNALGDFVGIMLSGVQMEQWGYSWSMTLIGVMCWTVSVICSVLWYTENRKSATKTNLQH